MLKLKKISRKGVSAALAKAERYRLLNEPKEAESICYDILAVESKNQKALIMLLLAITDQFDDEMGDKVEEARDLLKRLKGRYQQAYYEGIIHERQAKAALRRGTPGNQSHAYEWLRDAMGFYQKAEALHPAGNEDAILRWNTCARLIDSKNLMPRTEERSEQPLE